MAIIERNSYGAVAVNKNVIERMIIEDMLAMPDAALLCNKKGKPIKEKPTPFIDPDYFDAVEVSEKKGRVSVKIYVLIVSGRNISDTASTILDRVEACFELLKLDKPESNSVKVRGIISDGIIKRNIDILRKNDR